MRNHEDLPYILVERDSGGSFGSFCLGALSGLGWRCSSLPKPAKRHRRRYGPVPGSSAPPPRSACVRPN